jgi:alkyl hydroperoxide reductase subunit F
MLDKQLLDQLKQYFEKLERSIELALYPGEHEKRAELQGMLESIAAQSEKVTLTAASPDEEGPTDGLTFSVRTEGQETGIRFRGIPGGHEFNSLVLALLQAGGVPVRLDEDVIDMMKGLQGNLHFETVVSLDCHNCPDVVQTLNSLSLVSGAISNDMIDGALYPDIVEKYEVQGVPTVFLNGKPFSSGKVDSAAIISRLIERANEAGVAGAAGSPASKNGDSTESASTGSESGSAGPVYDVAIVGGGPGGVAAGIYSARKGLKVVLVADRLGGQLQDTMDIENLIALPHTTGTKLAGSLADQLRQNGIEVKEHLRVDRVENGEAYKTIQLNTGRSIHTRTLIIATGARWREMNVPGEMENLGRGVAFCPHCDGPFFKGKDVAVIGGGNSGVEAALDLSGIVKSVTLLEFAPELKADQVLQDRMAERSNISVIKSAQTTEVKADGKGVTGLVYTDRETNESREVPLDGVFVQIGLLPNSAFAEGLLERNQMGEILVDARCQTNVPGIFACGDVTNVPYKQIVVALGQGATASLSAFDYLIRHAPAVPKEMAGAAA